MKIARTIPAVRHCTRGAGSPVVLIPTMGALHAGHAALIDRARKVAGTEGLVVVSIFVNPTQFGPKEDLSRYPRPFAADRKLCADHGVNVIFQPSEEEMYPAEFSTHVEEESVSSSLCGASRPGHFRGVCTAVLKLIAIVDPDIAIFGAKDYQQGAVIRRMVRDLNLPVRVISVPTVREADGLALSSRNEYLGAEERAQAPVIRRALLAAREASRRGEISAGRLRRIIAREVGRSSLARVDYIEVVDANSLRKVSRTDCPSIAAAAVYFGSTRLIDNILL